MPRKNLQIFQAEHPSCCFCGGIRATATRDEVPPRSMFLGRRWPEGYQFPACEICNASSRQIDQLLALLSRLSFADHAYDQEETVRMARGVENNLPGFYPEPGFEEVEQETLDKLKLYQPADSNDDIVSSRISRDTLSSLHPFFRKLFCALYYKHKRSILRAQAPVALVLSTNQILLADDPFSWQRIPGLDTLPPIRRGKHDLSRQFQYAWGTEADGRDFAFSFHLRFALFGLMIGPVPESRLSTLPPPIVILR